MAVTVTAASWSDEVQLAALAGDGPALVRLYGEAEALFGSGASEKWAAALSAFDGTAVTG